jgi:hypothetical protein
MAHMLQNRIDPFGNIITTAARGAWTGNRGILVNDNKQIIRSFQLKAWITCLLEYKGRRRIVMSPHTWTELFFLDEATAFSAGHRPCFFCRNQDAKKFKSHWIAGNPEYGFTMTTSVQELDKVLHNERIDRRKQKRTHNADLQLLPDGAFISIEDKSYLVKGAHLHAWTPFGYETAVPRPASGQVLLLTPPSIINAFRAGYQPQIAATSF